jgi:hypothetical protein
MGMRGGGGVNTSQREWGVGELEFEALMRMLDNSVRNKITNVPVFFYMALAWRLTLMILMRENPLLGPLKGVGPENLDFLAQMALPSFVAISGPKKTRFSGPIPSKALEMDFPASNHYVPRHINIRYIISYLHL